MNLSLLLIALALVMPPAAEAQSPMATESASSTASSLASPQDAGEEEEETTELAEVELDEDAIDPEEEYKPLTIAGGLSSSMGQGTFVSNSFARNPYFAWSATLNPGWTFRDGTALTARLDLSQELTESDGDTHEQQLLLSDLTIGVGRKLATIPVVDINVSGSGSVSLPTSLASQLQRQFFAVRLGLGLSRKFGPVTLSYGAGARKNFHRYSTTALNPTRGENTILLAREGGNENIGESLIATGDNLASFSITNSLGVTYTPIENLSLGVSYALINGWTYNNIPKDEMSSEFAQGGRGQRDVSQASLSAGYQINDMFSLSAGILTVASPKSSDNKHVRFPLFDFESEAENLTTFFVDFTVTESFAL